jgi:hypothetical protein
MNKMWITLSVLLFAGFAQAQAMGGLQVNGQAGKLQLFQRVKAVRCDTTQRGVCDAPIYLNLNQAASAAEGSYIVGFENSLYPGLVNVRAGQTTTLNLEQVAIPPTVKGAKIRIYRDMSSDVEQKKIMLSMYWMKRHFFRVEKGNFGDLYLTGSWERDFVQRFNYDTCATIASLDLTNAESKAAKTVCAAWNGAKSEDDLAPLYEFNADGTMVENWVMFPGDVFPTTHPRYLVSAPMSEQDFVAVFPGAYKIQAEGKGMQAVTVRPGLAATQQNFNPNRIKLNFNSLP